MNFSPERWVGILAGIAAGVALLYYFYGEQRKQTAAAPAPVAAPAPAPALPGEPAEDPAQQAQREEQRARLAEDVAVSDDTVRSALASLFGADPIDAFLVGSRIIPSVVATVDSLDRAPIPIRHRALTAVPELPRVRADGDRWFLLPENGVRYRMLVDAFLNADADRIGELYRQHYPLMQHAYEELGYPGQSFHARLLAIIDHLLATPDVAGPIELVRPKVLYEYADPALEERSSGQKTLIRMGPENARAVKVKLRQLRAVLAARAPAAAP